MKKYKSILEDPVLIVRMPFLNSYDSCSIRSSLPVPLHYVNSAMFGLCALKTAPHIPKLKGLMVAVNPKTSSPKDVAVLSKVFSAVPNAEIVGLSVESKFLSPKEVIEYQKLGDIDTLRSQLLQIMNLGSFVCSSLQSHQKSLLSILKQREIDLK